jgi:nicotinate-nucleotide adenylyltransferase
MNIAIYGGTFDPLHKGHKAIIERLSTMYDRVIVVPTTIRYYKKNNCMFSFNYRVDELKKYTKLFNNVEVDDLEFDAPYDWRFIDTLNKLIEKYPDNKFFVAMGSDSFQTFQSWHRWQDIIKLATLVVFNRPGYNENLPIGIDHIWIKDIDIDVSSTKLREKMNEVLDEEKFEDYLLDLGWATDSNGDPIEFE